MERTLVLNASDEPLCLLPRRRAAVLVMADKADALAESDERLPRQPRRLAAQLRQAPSFPGIKQQEGAQEHRAARQESAHW